MNWSISQSTPPSAEPVSLAECKNHLRVDIAEDDTVITNMALAARQQVENETRRQLIDASFTLVLPEFPDVIELPRPPLDSVTSIKYYDSGGTLQTLAAAKYSVDTTGTVARVRPAYGESWPATRDVWNAVEIVYKAGYGAAASAVPEPLRMAILLLLGHWYEHREAVVIGTIASTLEMTVGALLGPYRVWFEDPEGK